MFIIDSISITDGSMAGHTVHYVERLIRFTFQSIESLQWDSVLSHELQYILTVPVVVVLIVALLECVASSSLRFLLVGPERTAK